MEPEKPNKKTPEQRREERGDIAREELYALVWAEPLRIQPEFAWQIRPATCQRVAHQPIKWAVFRAENDQMTEPPVTPVRQNWTQYHRSQ
jgi:hypothetical protein